MIVCLFFNAGAIQDKCIFLFHLTFLLRFKEIKMHKIIWEIIFYLIFLNITMLICFGDRDPNVFYVNKSMTDMFVKASYNGRLPFTKVRIVLDFVDLRETMSWMFGLQKAPLISTQYLERKPKSRI